MDRSPSRPNSVLLALALGLLLGACATSPLLTDEISARVDDAQVWNDRMPGSPPKCHATMHVTLANATDSTIVLFAAEGVLADARTGAPVRRFSAPVLFMDRETPEVRLGPGTEVTLTVRTPMGVPIIDLAEHPRLLLSVRFRTSVEGRDLVLSSRSLTPFETQ